MDFRPKVKYPRGPWHVDDYGFINNSDGKPVTYCPGIDTNECEYDTPETKALIIAAPEMLEAIIKTEDWLVKNIGFLNPETRKIIVRLTRIIHDVKATNKFSETPTNSQR